MTKNLPAVLATSIALAASAFAGDITYSTGKSIKQPIPPSPTGCFEAQEFQIDVFGQSSFGESGKIGAFSGTGWGGGVGLNYFFHRNIGLGIDAAWFGARHSELGNAPGDDNDSRTTFHNFSGSVIFRLPIDSACLAPYAYVGGGYMVNGNGWATAHAGVGLEYRVVPNKVGLFIDGRWTYLGDRFGEDDLNFWTARAGVRFVF